jgi:hypothetical protein
MIDFMAVAIVLYPLYIGMQLVYGMYLLSRAMKTRIYSLVLLTMISVFMALDVVVTDLELGPAIVRNLVMMNYPIFYLFFTKFAFYQGRKSAFRPLFALVCVLRVMHFIELQLFDQTMPPTHPVDTPERLAGYMLHFSLITGMHVISLAYLARASFLAHASAEKQHLERWIIKRNLLLGISAALYASQPILWIVVPTDGTAYMGSLQGFFVGIAIMCVGLLHATINLLAWIMPGWFKQFINRGRSIVVTARPEEMHDVVSAIAQRDLTSRETMLVVDFVGNLLAPLIRKNPSAAKGLLLLAIESRQDVSNKVMINFLEIRDVIATTLKDRLSSVNVQDPSAVVRTLLEEVDRNQYMILMMVV